MALGLGEMILTFIHSFNKRSRAVFPGRGLSCRLQMFIKERPWDHHLWKGEDGSGSHAARPSLQAFLPLRELKSQKGLQWRPDLSWEAGHYTLCPTVAGHGPPCVGGWTWPWLPAAKAPLCWPLEDTEATPNRCNRKSLFERGYGCISTSTTPSLSKTKNDNNQPGNLSQRPQMPFQVSRDRQSSSRRSFTHTHTHTHTSV